jgi:pSer/pThr/pTyr-binding forkhead associated (FHA) protein
MAPGCALCGGPLKAGVLCAACAEAIAPASGLLPSHVTATGGEARGWLVDGFGTPHALSADRTVVGRRVDAALAVLHASVSRDHAELRRDGDAWVLRDLGSRNGTHLDNRAITGREPLAHGARVRFGEIAFAYVAAGTPMPVVAGRSLETGHAASTFRYTIEGDGVELCLVSDGAGGLLLHRKARGAWSERTLSPLDLELLRVLCAEALADAASPAKTRGTVSTKKLLDTLPFTSKLAGEENVRQAVHRLREDLDALGAGALVASQPGRGYYLLWSVRAG